ncbi:hypothetical protein ACFQL1_16070 [Halomicroarcula sp. GCM10025709]|uniref:hypothetical protein n=1 Tax=Haloarcula TaxID=2237 RepID=UPI0024C3FD3F|nr:hypothetical protein [Halomicroarcula sp. YJ-61-S]
MAAHPAAEDLPFDAERLPLPLGQPASDRALAVLDEIAANRATVHRVREVCQEDAPASAAGATDWTRTLAHADGELVATTWSSTGVTEVGYDPEDESYEVVGWSALAETMGNDARFAESASASKARDLLGGAPQLIHREESDRLGGER